MFSVNSIAAFKRILVIVPAIALIVLGLPTADSQSHTEINEQSDDLIRLTFFYKPPDSDRHQEEVIREYDTVILTRRDEWFRDQILEDGTQVVLQYLTFERIHDPCDQARLPSDAECGCTGRPRSNNVGWEKTDICWIRDNHPEWFLRNEDGDVFYGGNDMVFMDIGNPEWQEFYLERVRYSQEELGWNGVFLDNVRGSLGRFRDLEETVPKYPTDESYVAATTDFLQFLYTEYFQPEGRLLYANLRSMPEDSNEVWASYLQYLDGAMDEFWAVDHGDNYFSPEQWAFSLERALITQDAGDEFIAVAQGDREDRDRQEFALASFLLVADGTSAFRYTRNDDYSHVWDYANYYIDLGAPLNTLYQERNEWRRDFENGTVIVNPERQTATIDVDE